MPCPAYELERDRAIRRDMNVEANCKAFEARCALDGAGVLVARSGTACRAPTGETAKATRTRARSSQVLGSAERFYLRYKQECLCY